MQDFPNGQLGDEGPIAEGVGSGSIDIGLGGVVDAIDPKLDFIELRGIGECVCCAIP